jgi:hypothetical protein
VLSAWPNQCSSEQTVNFLVNLPGHSNTSQELALDLPDSEIECRLARPRERRPHCFPISINDGSTQWVVVRNLDDLPSFATQVAHREPCDARHAARCVGLMPRLLSRTFTRARSSSISFAYLRPEVSSWRLSLAMAIRSPRVENAVSKSSFVANRS